MQLPQKRSHRQRAHCNPFSDHDLDYPLSPELVDKRPDILDVGCGYGGMLFCLSELFPNKEILGMEIRKKLVDYVNLKIQYLQSEKGLAHNVSAVRTNTMKFLPNYVAKASLAKMLILFPDPHFKKKKHKARIVSTVMLDVYSYVLVPEGRLYLATDVEELFLSMCACVEGHPLFRRLSVEEAEQDELWPHLVAQTEESKKADMKHSQKYRAIFQNIS
ncbi:tRNA (guanine-N7-)-methyltransferase [Nematocida homosporus]|uniref:tRNA (guanine-N7-)-methyltransferase n=1 Tax=Nematocida homosporus TaxID=1912981 RepID=UPI00221ED00A|nr:tRNA (guanine-N7-)-methyltransferase [Nematocida homosporus]KAI5186275.1 tRNA (guanine-N7-)-methyltransferase [Nematocida homosporus]